MKESYGKRFNIFINKIKEDENQSWKKRDETVKKFQNFLEKGLKIQDSEDVNYVNIHRLPQHRLKKNGKAVHRPTIVKLLTIQDKNLIFKSAKHLQNYNAERLTEHHVSPYIYITDHFPVKFRKQRKRLLAVYKEAK